MSSGTVDHRADVAACAEGVLERTVLRRRLAALASTADLTDQHVARLGVFVAIHEVGKFSDPPTARRTG